MFFDASPASQKTTVIRNVRRAERASSPGRAERDEALCSGAGEEFEKWEEAVKAVRATLADYELSSFLCVDADNAAVFLDASCGASFGRFVRWARRSSEGPHRGVFQAIGSPRYCREKAAWLADRPCWWTLNSVLLALFSSHVGKMWLPPSLERNNVVSTFVQTCPVLWGSLGIEEVAESPRRKAFPSQREAEKMKTEEGRPDSKYVQTRPLLLFPAPSFPHLSCSPGPVVLLKQRRTLRQK
jgi:hypothetical protein